MTDLHLPDRSLQRKLWLLAVCYAAGFGLALPLLARLIIACGHFIVQPDMLTDYGTALVWATLLSLSLLFWPVSFQNRMALLLAWVAKMGVTLGFMLFYESFYDLDAMEYFRTTPPWSADYRGINLLGIDANGSDNVSYLFWLHNRALPYSYHTMKVSCAMLGLISIYLFYRAAVMYLGHEDRRIFYLLAFCPGILFWSSTLGKDPITLLGIALYFYGVMGLYLRRQSRFLPLAALGLVIALGVRIWLVPLLLLPTTALVYGSTRSRRARVFAICGIVLLIGLALGPIFSRLAIGSFEDALQVTDYTSKAWGRGGSGQQLDIQFNSVGSVLRFLPLGMFTALFRPLPGEILNPFGLLSGFENVGLLYLLWRAIQRTRRKDFRDPVVLWATLSVLFWAAFYAFISYQNLGAAVRFRLQILPVLLLVLLYLARSRPVPLERGS